MRITSTDQVANNAIKILVYGESGSGKTTLARTLKEPTLIISAESGTLSLRGTSIDVIDISQDDEGKVIPKENRIDRLGEVYKYLQTDEARAKYKNIFIDSLTEISQCLVDMLKVKFPERKDSLVLYGENADKMRSMIKLFRDIPYYNVIMVALAVKEKDDNNRVFYGVDCIGKISNQLVQFFDEVFFLGVVDEADGTRKRLLQTGKSEKINAKDRSSVLDMFEPADLGLIFNKIKGTS